MCPPVEVRLSSLGVSYLYASWLYELQHGGYHRPQVCFACFKVAFQNFKTLLEDLEDEDWEDMDLEESEPEQEGAPGPGPDPGQPAQEVALPGTQGPVQVLMVPSELMLLGLGSKHEDWAQALPWKIPKLPHCAHWPKPPPPDPVFPRVTLSLVEPVLLELGTMWPVQPMEAEAWLLDLQVFCVMGYQDTTIYLRKMTPTQALSCPGERWRVLLEPGEIWMSNMKVQGSVKPQDLLHYPLGIQERTKDGVTSDGPEDSCLAGSLLPLHLLFQILHGNPAETPGRLWNLEPNTYTLSGVLMS
ncbi:testis-expressed protein 19.2-like [Heterocephalus glaber]|uniref:Testis-expressed protein 19.2-like n=1 Tax=Heterocephalus glaber TaxID=10181 RepID=A0AAX6R3H1_HETGA|nr:testis-expressed protein 19.2-like [Heterocephalus glaber]